MTLFFDGIFGRQLLFSDVQNGVNIAAINAVKAENEVLQLRVESAENRAALAEQKLTLLQHQFDQLKRLVYGVKRERFEPASGPDQLILFGTSDRQEPAPAPAVETVTRKVPTRRPARQVLPSHLPREVVVIEPDGVDVSVLKKIGEEVTETLDYRPAKITVLRRVRPKYVDPTAEERGVVIAALPPRPVEKGMAEPGLLAHVVIEKYVDHLPLYRQVQRFKREGITLSDSTLGDWIAASADLLEPIYEAMSSELLASAYLQADETPIPVQDSETKGKTHRGYYWVYHAPEEKIVVMDYQPGRGRDGPAKFLGAYEGALQSDGYTAYDSFDRLPGITGYRCWAHARRYFFEAQGSSPHEAAHALKEIGLLYDIERELRESASSTDHRREVRQQRAVPILTRFQKWLEANRGLPKSPWGKAVNYALGQWKMLCRYAEDGRIEIDNNLVENAIRPIALGRKNYLFAGSHEAAQRAAVIYSLVATCKKHEVNPHAWMSDVLSRIPTHPHKRVHELLPHHWKNSKG